MREFLTRRQTWRLTQVSAIDYLVFEMQCKFVGSGVYRFDGPITTSKIVMNRLNDGSLLIIEAETINVIEIEYGHMQHDNSSTGNYC
jgi:hypothetical protein